jgi:hypothetical protein
VPPGSRAELTAALVWKEVADRRSDAEVLERRRCLGAPGRRHEREPDRLAPNDGVRFVSDQPAEFRADPLPYAQRPLLTRM